MYQLYHCPVATVSQKCVRGRGLSVKIACRSQPAQNRLASTQRPREWLIPGIVLIGLSMRANVFEITQRVCNQNTGGNNDAQLVTTRAVTLARVWHISTLYEI
jgi:hypothetical protein